MTINFVELDMKRNKKLQYYGTFKRKYACL